MSFAAVCDRSVGPTPSPLRASSHDTACVRSPHPSLQPPVAFTRSKLLRRRPAPLVLDLRTKKVKKAAVKQHDMMKKKKKKRMLLSIQAVKSNSSFAEV